jgi:hypothetical protein
MSRPNPSLLAFYRLLLRLYPHRLRLRYQEEMLQSVRDACAERRETPPRLWLRLFTDLLTSSLKEHLLMVRDQAVARPVFFHALILGLILTVMGGSAAVAFQQLLRRGADEPQIQMAEDYAAGLASGQRPSDVIPLPMAIIPTPPIVARREDGSQAQLWTCCSIRMTGGVDIDRSLQPFALVYDESGSPIFSNGFLDQAIPAPPHGVFDYLRSHATDKFTWQPRHGVRIAAVARRIDGPHPGFVLVGRSLALVEDQEGLLYHATFIGWFVLVGLLCAGAALLSRVQSSTLTSEGS